MNLQDFDLKPCPFCGNGATIMDGTSRTTGLFVYVRCPNCQAHSKAVYQYDNDPVAVYREAIAAWNRRAELRKRGKHMTLENQAKCITIANTYGFTSQREVLTEECAELIQAVQKLKRTEGGDAEKESRATEHYLEELADVIVMTEQMKHYLTPALRNDLNDFITNKLDRQLDRIAKEKEEYQKWRKNIKA